jgi:hypothetical protein
MEAPQNRRLYFDVESFSPLAQLYRWKEDNICQSIWDEIEHVGEHIGNILGTHWELKRNTVVPIENQGKMKNKILAPPPNGQT